MAAAIGLAVPSASMADDGAADGGRRHLVKPSRAEAAPARRGKGPMAPASALGRIRPMPIM